MTAHWQQDELINVARARRGDPSTSHEAAASLGDVRASQALVLGLLRTYGPSTDEQLAALATMAGVVMSPSGLRTRRHELVTLALVEPSGEQRVMSTGRRALVWQAVPT